MPPGSVVTLRTLPPPAGVCDGVGTTGHRYPTPAHARAADEIVAFFAADARTDAVLLTNSCARGKATPDSCLDVQVLAREPEALWAAWEPHAAASPVVAELLAVGRFSDLHLDVGSGDFRPGPIEDEGIDWFEVTVGNLLVHSVPLWTRGERFDELRAQWLPYYGDELRAERLEALRGYFVGNVDRIPWYLDRGIWFQPFHRLLRAFHAFLMALHVSRRTYPISYDKWIHEQVAERLGLPELYARLPGILEVARLESRDLERNADALRALYDEYVEGGTGGAPA